MKYMNVGDKVMVYIPAEDRKVHKCVAQYHQKEMRISARRSFVRGQKVYYELSGAESEYGIPYGFIREWLIQL